MGRIRALHRHLAILFWLSVLLQPMTVHAQEVVARESLDEWFYSRLLWGSLVGIVCGVVIGLLHLCRLPFEARNVALNINSRARRRLVMWLIIIFLFSGLLLFLDAWLLYPFGAMSLTLWDALTQVWLNYRMLLILFATLITFIFMVSIVTRFKSDCRCRYAFIPGPGVK